jgi:hypothetical protein
MPDDIETVDAEVVPAASAPGAIESARRTLPPATVQAAVAATGFAAGMATVAAVKRHRLRKASRRRRGALGKVVASRSFLVDVHVLANRG